MNQQAIRATVKSQEINLEMRELIEGSQDRANASPSIEPAIPSDLNGIRERASGGPLAEMDKTIQELQKARNFLLNKRERMQQEMAEYLRLTKAALGSSRGCFGRHCKSWNPCKRSWQKPRRLSTDRSVIVGASLVAPGSA
jgi:hypothetical protein